MSYFQMFSTRSGSTNRRHQRSYYGVVLLLTELSRTSNLPPITLAVIILNVLIYFDFLPYWIFSTELQSACISTHAVLNQADYLRLFSAPLVHGDDMHLYYNMASFLYKGQKLERLFGSPYFSLLLFILTVSSSFMTVLLGQVAATLLDDPSYLYSCAVGFSAVIFSLKVITTHYTPDQNIFSFFGVFLPISAKYLVWFELVLIQLITPNVSFIGTFIYKEKHTNNKLRMVFNFFRSPSGYSCRASLYSWSITIHMQ